MGLGIHGPAGGFASQRPDKLGWCIAVHRPGSVAVGKARPRQCVVGVEFSSAGEGLDCFSGCWGTEMLPEMPPVKIQIVGFSISGLAPSKRAQTFRRKSEAYLFGDGLAELALHRQHASRSAVIRGRPYLQLIAYADELGRNPQTVAFCAQ